MVRSRTSSPYSYDRRSPHADCHRAAHSPLQTRARRWAAADRATDQTKSQVVSQRVTSRECRWSCGPVLEPSVGESIIGASPNDSERVAEVAGVIEVPVSPSGSAAGAGSDGRGCRKCM